MLCGCIESVLSLYWVSCNIRRSVHLALYCPIIADRYPKSVVCSVAVSSQFSLYTESVVISGALSTWPCTDRSLSLSIISKGRYGFLLGGGGGGGWGFLGESSFLKSWPSPLDQQKKSKDFKPLTLPHYSKISLITLPSEAPPLPPPINNVPSLSLL